MKWRASITIGLGSISLEDIKNEPKYYKRFFKDLNNPTENEIRDYFRDTQEEYAGSNTGSEYMANADIEIEKEVS